MQSPTLLMRITALKHASGLLILCISMEFSVGYYYNLLCNILGQTFRIEGGIPPLVELLEFVDVKVQRAAAGALRTLAFKNDENKNQVDEFCRPLIFTYQESMEVDFWFRYTVDIEHKFADCRM